jgi:hypothetical protein
MAITSRKPSPLQRVCVRAYLSGLLTGEGKGSAADGLPVMKATAKAKRHSKEQGGVHVKSPFEPSASKSHQTEANQCNVIPP